MSTGALRDSTLVSRSSPWTYPPPSSPSFSSLSSSLGFVMGESPGGVSFNTCCFCKWRSSSVARVDFLTCATNALALFQNKPNYQKIGCRNMEVNVGNQSWVHWSMHLAKICTYEESWQGCTTLHTCSFDTTCRSFVQQCNEKTVPLTCQAPPVMSLPWFVRYSAHGSSSYPVLPSRHCV